MSEQLDLLPPEWGSFAAASRAKTSAERAKARALRAIAPDSGTSSVASLPSLSRRASSSRTSPPVSGVGCPTCGETCTCWDTERVPCRFLPSMSARPTVESECSCLLPTPSASEFDSNQGGAAGRVGPVRYSLGGMARRGLLATPMASSGGGTFKRGNPKLTTCARQGLLPTPTVKGNNNREGASPTSGDALGTAVGGPLSPRFVEWLMGFPDGWTEIAPSEMQSIRVARRSRAKSSKSG